MAQIAKTIVRNVVHRMLAVGIILLLASAHALAATAEEARQYVDQVGKSVLEVLNGTGDEAQKQQQLRQMFAEHMDTEWMGRFVLARGWNQATEEQKRRYLAAYRDYLLARYTTNFADYTGSNYTITDVTSEAEGQFTVSMEVNSPHAQQQETQAGYRVRAENGGFKIIDIIIEGVSLIVTQRSEFSSVLQQKSMDGLIEAIEAKTRAKEGGHDERNNHGFADARMYSSVLGMPGHLPEHAV